MAKAKKLPKEMLIYQYDEVDGEPVYSAVCNVDDIPEDADGQRVGVYVLNTENLFRVRRELK